LLPILDVLQSFPSFVLFPILIIALKNSPNIIIVSVLVITIIWPIVFAIISGIKGKRTDLEEAATIFGATGAKRFFNFTLPVLFPSIVTGSLVGWGEGWEFIIGAELLVHTRIGVGQYLGDISSAGKTQLLLFGILLLLFLLFIINKLIWLPLLHRSTRFQADA
jgi:NitT/TauT family transport system permease protein